MTFKSSPRTSLLRTPARVGGVIVAIATALSLAACAAPVDPVETRETLQEVTEPQAPDQVADQLAADVEPIEIEPIDCSDVLVITARGTGEPEKGQLLSPVARAIAKAMPDQVEVVNLDYPADTNVNAGATLGVRTLIGTLNQQAEECPEQTFVLLGYSQGAMVIGDALSTPDVRLVGTEAEEIVPEAADGIGAVVFYGNPRFSGREPYNAGNYSKKRDGLLPRQPNALEEFDDRLRDYCVGDDFICQATTTGLDEEGHVEYFDNGMQQEGSSFALTKLDASETTPEEPAKASKKEPKQEPSKAPTKP